MPARIEKSGFWVRVTCVIFYPIYWLVKVRATGREGLRRDGGIILVMNHISHLDPAVDAVFVHRQGRVPRFFAKESLFRTPVFKYLIGGAGSIPVARRSAGAADSLGAGNDALRKGRLIVIYPEGTITKDPTGWPMKAKSGAARLALDNLEHDIPVFTAARWGTHNVLNGYTKKFRPFPRKKVFIDVSEPVDLSAYKGKPVTKELVTEVTDLLMTQIRDQLARLRDEPAPAEFYDPVKARRNGGSTG